MDDDTKKKLLEMLNEVEEKLAEALKKLDELKNLNGDQDDNA